MSVERKKERINQKETTVPDSIAERSNLLVRGRGDPSLNPAWGRFFLRKISKENF